MKLDGVCPSVDPEPTDGLHKCGGSRVGSPGKKLSKNKNKKSRRDERKVDLENEKTLRKNSMNEYIFKV